MVTDITMTELKKIVAETNVAVKNLAKSQDETQREMRKTQREVQETQRVVRELSRNVGGVNLRLGEIVELVVLPGLIKGMNDLGHNFTISSPRKRFSKNGEYLSEVDLLLENGEEVMVVEAKSRFKTGDMNELLARVKLLRKNEKITGMTGRRIFAAAAGMGFDPEARKIAADKGIYLVNISIDYYNEKLKIIPPPKGKVGTW